MKLLGTYQQHGRVFARLAYNSDEQVCAWSTHRTVQGVAWLAHERVAEACLPYTEGVTGASHGTGLKL